MVSRVQRYFLELKDFSNTINLNLPENYQIILDDNNNFQLVQRGDEAALINGVSISLIILMKSQQESI